MKPLRRAWLPALALLALSGCRCGDGSLGTVELGFRVEGSPVDFGRVLQGQTVQRELTVISTSRGSVVLEASADSPFSVETPLSLPGGASVTLPVSFTAGVGLSEGELVLTQGQRRLSVPLRGVGVVPLPCPPSAVCRRAHFEVESGLCVEEVSPDGDACTPQNICLEAGVCQQGACLGTPRSCDDGDRCTTDGCSPTAGCVHSLFACPTPVNPCHVSVCNSDRGCQEAVAPDQVVCGPLNCVTANLCLSGTCTAVATPEGFVCAPKTPCEGVSRCHQQVCTRPDAGPMTRLFSASSALPPATTEGGLLLYQGNLYFERCAVDGGCELASYTQSGFERNRSPAPDSARRRVVGATDGGVVVGSDRGFEAYSAFDGALAWAFGFERLTRPPEAPGAAPVWSSQAQTAVSAGSEVWSVVGWATDAGPLEGARTLFKLRPDGGLSSEQVLREPFAASVVALDRFDRALLYDPDGGAVALLNGADAGLQWVACGGGPASLGLSDGLALVGGRAILDLDAGLCRGPLPWLDDAGLPGEVLARPALLSAGQAYGFYRSCGGALSPCGAGQKQTLVRAFDARALDGGYRWEAPVTPLGVAGSVVEAAVVPLAGGGVVTLSELVTDAGPLAHLQYFSQGARVFACALPAGTHVQAGSFETGTLYVLAQRDGGQWVEGYDLAALPIAGGGWATPDGTAGSRRE